MFRTDINVKSHLTTERLNTDTEQKTDTKPTVTSLPQENAVGMNVFHSKYGNGIITDQASSLITVSFTDKTLKFEYPKAFTRKFLKPVAN